MLEAIPGDSSHRFFYPFSLSVWIRTFVLLTLGPLFHRLYHSSHQPSICWPWAQPISVQVSRRCCFFSSFAPFRGLSLVFFSVFGTLWETSDDRHGGSRWRWRSIAAGEPASIADVVREGRREGGRAWLYCQGLEHFCAQIKAPLFGTWNFLVDEI